MLKSVVQETQALEHEIEPTLHIQSAATLLAEGRRQFAAGDLRAASACFRQVVHLEVRNGAAWNNLAVSLNLEGRWDEAREAFAHALALRPNDADVAHNLKTLLLDHDGDGQVTPTLLVSVGEDLFAAGRLADAHEHFVLAIQTDDSCIDAWNNLGVVLVELGQIEAAEAALVRALALDPENVNAMNNLACLHLAQGRTDEARQGFLDALALDPFDMSAPERLINGGLLPIVDVAKAQTNAKVLHALRLLDDAGPAAMLRVGVKVTSL